jgi:hypothetical protein
VPHRDLTVEEAEHKIARLGSCPEAVDLALQQISSRPRPETIDKTHIRRELEWALEHEDSEAFIRIACSTLRHKLPRLRLAA